MTTFCLCCLPILPSCLFFFFNDTATTEIYTLSLHDALPISPSDHRAAPTHRLPIDRRAAARGGSAGRTSSAARRQNRSEEHTSELQSRQYLVCRLLLEKKKKKTNDTQPLDPPMRFTQLKIEA